MTTATIDQAAPAAVRDLARTLLLKHVDEDPGYRDAVRIACEIDDDNPRVAIKAHRMLAEYTAEFVLEAGQVDEEVVPLLNALNDFIQSFPGYELYVNGEWSSCQDVWKREEIERGDPQIGRIVALLRARRRPWVSAPQEASAIRLGRGVYVHQAPGAVAYLGSILDVIDSQNRDTRLGCHCPPEKVDEVAARLWDELDAVDPL